MPYATIMTGVLGAFLRHLFSHLIGFTTNHEAKQHDNRENYQIFHKGITILSLTNLRISYLDFVVIIAKEGSQELFFHEKTPPTYI